MYPVCIPKNAFELPFLKENRGNFSVHTLASLLEPFFQNELYPYTSCLTSGLTSIFTISVGRGTIDRFHKQIRI